MNVCSMDRVDQQRSSDDDILTGAEEPAGQEDQSTAHDNLKNRREQRCVGT